MYGMAVIILILHLSQFLKFNPLLFLFVTLLASFIFSRKLVYSHKLQRYVN
jgi:hypothetical protein